MLLNVSREELRERFAALRRPEDVALMIEMSYARLIYWTYARPEDSRYRQFAVRKRNGGLRTLSEPATALKVAQGRLNQVFQAVYIAKPPVHGFVPERSIVTNAQSHVRKRFVFNADIEDFFPSINFGRVRGLFMKYPYRMNADVATFFARLCTHNNGLPQGAPTSPILANMICARMDKELQVLAKRHRCNYTRYADDLTFSTSTHRFPSAIAQPEGDFNPAPLMPGPELNSVILGNGFKLNPAKIRLQRHSSRQQVTGLVVNRFPNVSRKFVSQIRAMLHAWERYGLAGAEREFRARYDSKDRGGFDREVSFASVVKGRIDYMAMVRGRSDRLVQQLLTWYGEVNPSYSPRPGTQTGTRPRDALWVLECHESSSQGTAFMLEGYGLVTCAHVLGPTTRAFRPDAPGQHYAVTVRVRNDALDVAILDFDTDADTGPSLRKGRSDRLREGSSVTVTGFPNFRYGDSGWASAGAVAGFRMVSTVRRLLIDTPIVGGASGGPVLDSKGRVIGVAVTGADRMENADTTEHHGVIPIETIDRL